MVNQRPYLLVLASPENTPSMEQSNGTRWERPDAPLAGRQIVGCKAGDGGARTRPGTGTDERTHTEPDRSEASPCGVRQHRERPGHGGGV